MNKIVAISMVKNEADVIESSMRHALTFVDEILVCDHQSTDGTLEILNALHDEGLPIQVSTCKKIGFVLIEVWNELTREAFENGADIVIPVDADEFHIMPGGKNSQDMRNFLQNLDANQSYLIDWIQCAFVEPDKDQDQFTLNRQTLRSRGVSKGEPARKLIVGRGAWEKFDLQLKIHLTFLPDGNIFPMQMYLPQIQNFHYRYRSEAQWLSKDLSLYLQRIVQDTFYTSAAPHSQHNVRDFLAGAKLSANDINQIKVIDDPIPADIDLKPYQNEVTLKFTGGGASILYAMSFCSHNQSHATAS